MAFRTTNAGSDFFDSLVAGGCGNATLETIEELVDWKAIRELVAATYDKSGRGAPAIDPLILVKMLLLEALYGLSDVRVASECADRLSFRKFLGLSLSDKTPDDTTLVRFRERLRRHDLVAQIEGVIESSLAQKGLYIRPGSIALVDATLIKAAVNPPGRDGKTGERREPLDRDADSTVKEGQEHYGYKLHIAQDLASGLVTRHEVTPASIHDSRLLTALLLGNESAVLADKAYDNIASRHEIEQWGGMALLMHRLRGRKKAWGWLPQINRRITRWRCAVETTFANLKKWRRCGRAMYRNIDKVAAQMTWGVIAHNLLCYRRWQDRCA